MILLRKEDLLLLTHAAGADIYRVCGCARVRAAPILEEARTELTAVAGTAAQ
jgi:hypothetical protein